MTGTTIHPPLATVLESLGHHIATTSKGERDVFAVMLAMLVKEPHLHEVAMLGLSPFFKPKTPVLKAKVISFASVQARRNARQAVTNGERT